MEYQSTNDLPPTIRDVLPERAQELYLDAYNQAWEMYDPDATTGQSRQTLAHQQGWLAVRKEYVLDEGTGLWHLRGETEEEEEEERKGLIDRIKSLF